MPLTRNNLLYLVDKVRLTLAKSKVFKSREEIYEDKEIKETIDLLLKKDKNKMRKYIIETENDDLDIFVKAVNARIEAGYRPLGGVQIKYWECMDEDSCIERHETYYQTLIRN